MHVAASSSVGMLLVLAMSTACASRPPPPSRPSPLVGQVMPAFEGETMSGNPVISGSYQGHTVVVLFTGTRCDGCERALSAAQAVYADNRDLVVVGVFRPEDPEKAARSLAARLELRFPLLIDRQGVIARRFGATEVPSAFVADRRGRVRWVGGTDVTKESLAMAVDWAD